MENELDTALHIEEVNTLEQALQVDFKASVEMPTGKMQDLQSPPTAQEEMHRSPFRKMFQPSEKVELNGLLDVGCFQVVDEKDAPKGRKVVGSRWVRTYKGDGYGSCSKTKSRGVAKGFTQVQYVDYYETTSPPSPRPRFHLDVAQAFVQAPLEEESYMRPPTGCCELSGKVVKLLNCQYGLKQAGREWHLLQVTWLVKKIGMEQCKVVR